MTPRCRRCGSGAARHRVGLEEFVVCVCGEGAQQWQDATATASSASVTPARRRDDVLVDMRNQLRWYYLNPLSPWQAVKRDRLIERIADLENECDALGMENR